MDILQGLLKINGTDIYKEFGVFLTEKKEGEFTNYDALMKGASTKEQTEVSFPERDGVELPDEIEIKLQPREVVLYFCIYSKDTEEYFVNYGHFFEFLRKGKKGWLEFDLKELNRTFLFHYVDTADYEQLTPMKGGGVGSRFHLKFREPKPQF